MSISIIENNIYNITQSNYTDWEDYSQLEDEVCAKTYKRYKNTIFSLKIGNQYFNYYLLWQKKNFKILREILLENDDVMEDIMNLNDFIRILCSRPEFVTYFPSFTKILAKIDTDKI